MWGGKCLRKCMSQFSWSQVGQFPRLLSRRTLSLRTCSTLVTSEKSTAETLFEDLGAEVDGPNLSVGSPSPAELARCASMLKQAATWRMSQDNVQTLFQYGPKSGDPAFRRALADFLTSKYDDEVLADELIPTAGATQGLAMLTSFYFSTGDIVFVEDLTFFVALNYFRNDLGLRIVSVRSDDDGIIPGEVERLVNKHSKELRTPNGERPFRAMLYTIPTFHNPTGRCLSAPRRAELISVARRCELLVACDDVYNILPLSLSDDITIKMPRRLASYDNYPHGDPGRGNVVSNGTFSKIFGPGFRLGWLEGPDRILEPLRKSNFIRSGGAVQHVVAGIAEGLISLGLLQNHVNYCQKEFQKRARVLDAALKKHMPPGVTWNFPDGGFFIWVRLPNNLDGEVLEESLREDSVLVYPGVKFSPDGNFRDYIRLSFSYSSERLLEEGARIIGEHIRRHLEC